MCALRQKSKNPSDEPPTTKPLAFTKDPVRLTIFLKTMLWIQLGIAVLALLSDFGQLNLAIRGPFTTAEAAANDARQGLIALTHFVVFLVTGTAFLKWVYRANENCHGFDAQGMRFSPRWSIGCYFVPFLNLVRPYQAMKEIWQVSRSPEDWENQPNSPLVSWWWALWLAVGFLSQLVFRLTLAVNSPTSLEAVSLASIASESIEIAVCVVAFFLVSSIFEMQNNLLEKNVYRSNPYQRHYDTVAQELDNADLKSGLWTRAIAEAGGENDRAKALYIRFRVSQLAEDEQKHAEMQERAQEERKTEAEKERKKKAELDTHPTRCLFCGEAISSLSEICEKCGRPIF
jgi:hypothetical protein